jgi:hypothetical protein
MIAKTDSQNILLFKSEIKLRQIDRDNVELEEKGKERDETQQWGEYRAPSR